MAFGEHLMRCLPRLVPLLVAVASPAIASPIEVEGVSFPDTIDVGGKTLHRIGAGLREVTFLKVDVYAGAMYAERASCDLVKLATEDQARAFRMDFLRDVPADRLYANQVEMTRRALPDGAPADLRARLDRFNEQFREDVRKGMRILVRYVPGEGTSVLVDGRQRGPVVPGLDFANVIFGVWFGPESCCPGLVRQIRETCR